MRLRGWNIAGVLTAGLLALTIGVLGVSGFTEPAIRLLIRDTARISTTLFTLAFAASSLWALLHRPWTRWLLENRRYLGVSFAIAHGAHLVCLGILALYFPHPFRDGLNAVRVGIGAGAYLLIALMAATSFDKTAALVGPRAWRALHKIGVYYVWILLFLAYAGRAAKEPWYIPLATLIVFGMLARIVAWIVEQKRRTGENGLSA